MVVLSKVLPTLLALLLMLLPHKVIKPLAERPPPLQITVIEKPRPVVAPRVEVAAVISKVPATSSGAKKKRARHASGQLGLLKMLGSAEKDDAISGVFAGGDVAILGALSDNAGVEGGVGGLGLSGVGLGGGGTGLGVGGLGSLGSRSTRPVYTNNVSAEEMRKLLGDRPIENGGARTIVRLSIDAEGNVTNVAMISTPSAEFAELARSFGMKMKFKPARDEKDHPYATTLVWTIHWARD